MQLSKSELLAVGVQRAMWDRMDFRGQEEKEGFPEYGRRGRTPREQRLAYDGMQKEDASVHQAGWHRRYYTCPSDFV